METKTMFNDEKYNYIDRIKYCTTIYSYLDSFELSIARLISDALNLQ